MYLIYFNAILQILQELNVLRARTKESGEDLRNMEQEQEKFAISYHNCTKMNGKNRFFICFLHINSYKLLIF